MSVAPRLWLNGKLVDAGLPLSRGLHYGDGVFRTMLLWQGSVVDLDAQLAHLAHDANVLDLALPASLETELEAAAREASSGVAKVLLWRAGEGRGYRSTTSDTDRLVIRYALPDWNPANAREGIAAIRSPVVMAAQPRLAGIKHLNRLEQVLASRAWPEGIDEALLGDDRGHPVCGTRSNLFWVRRGVLHTPALERCGVAGRMRARVLGLAAREGIDTRIVSEPWSALHAADEAFISNSLIGLWPLRALDDHRWPAPGPVSVHLMRALAHPTLPA